MYWFQIPLFRGKLRKTAYEYSAKRRRNFKSTWIARFIRFGWKLLNEKKYWVIKWSTKKVYLLNRRFKEIQKGKLVNTYCNKWHTTLFILKCFTINTFLLKRHLHVKKCLKMPEILLAKSTTLRWQHLQRDLERISPAVFWTTSVHMICTSSWIIITSPEIARRSLPPVNVTD